MTAGLAYGAALGITLASLAWARERQRARREHELIVAARDAELSLLKAQFQPHFVLNALNSLLALVDRDPALARTMIVRLADLMKAVFARADADQVPLERELDLVRAYLDVERIRLGSRLAVTFDIDDAARGVLVPALLLQPIVENAVKHGVLSSRQGWIDVDWSIEGDRFLFSWKEAGGETALSEPAASGFGLELLLRSLPYDLGAETKVAFDPSGLRFTLSAATRMMLHPPHLAA